MLLKFNSEVLAIHALRGKFPEMPAKALARAIRNQSFNQGPNRTLAARAVGAGRTLLSVYSVIRRHDRQTLPVAAATAQAA